MGHRRWAAGLVLTGILTVLLAVPSWAQAEEVASDPADRSQISVVPPAVSLTFNQDVLQLGTRVLITGPGGEAGTAGPSVSGNVVRQSVAPGAPAGRYTVRWKVTSDDGHPLSGSFSFRALAAAGAPAVSPSPAEAVSPTPAGTSSPAPAGAGGNGQSGDGGLPGLAVIGLGAVVLAVLMGAFTAISRIRRSGASASGA